MSSSFPFDFQQHKWIDNVWTTVKPSWTTGWFRFYVVPNSLCMCILYTDSNSVASNGLNFQLVFSLTWISFDSHRKIKKNTTTTKRVAGCYFEWHGMAIIAIIQMTIPLCDADTLSMKFSASPSFAHCIVFCDFFPCFNRIFSVLFGFLIHVVINNTNKRDHCVFVFFSLYFAHFR